MEKFKIVEVSCPDHPVIEEEFDRRDAMDIKEAASCFHGKIP